MSEFRVKWAEPVEDGELVMDEMARRSHTKLDRQLHRMRMLRHMLKVGGFEVIRTEEDGTLVYSNEATP